jgi:transcription elongation factor GreB
MSSAFVKESAESAPPPERMVSEGFNPVTQAGYEQIVAHVARIEAALKAGPEILLRETLERDLRYWSVAKARAEIAKPSPDGSVAFGSRVTLLRNGKRQAFQIVGEDEADPANAKVSWRAPLAQAIIGARVGDIVEMEKPPGEIEIVDVEN